MIELFQDTQVKSKNLIVLEHGITFFIVGFSICATFLPFLNSLEQGIISFLRDSISYTTEEGAGKKSLCG